jgi:hypothetical protein
MTVFFDAFMILFSVFLAVLYRSQRRDVIKLYTNDESTSYIMHPIFERIQEKICLAALIILGLSTIFLQTIFQGFILIVLIVMFWTWAHNQLDKNSQRIMILNFAQGLVLLQLSLTFAFQVTYFKQEIVASESTFAWDMFGLLLHKLRTY